MHGQQNIKITLLSYDGATRGPSKAIEKQTLSLI